jgi:thymidylate synthase
MISKPIPVPIDIQYLNLLDKVLKQGLHQKDRTDVGSSIQLFGQQLKFDTLGEYAPFIQHRSFGTKTSFLEFIWMMRGNTDASFLRANHVHIWDAHTSREFLDSRNLHNLPEWNIGKSYSYQFRNFSGKIDQLKQILESIKSEPYSRRHVISIWNPAELDEAPLAPCCHLYEFMVQGDTINMYQHMRSADLLLGVPYNLSFGYYLLSSVAKMSGLKTGKIMLTMTNVHVYNNQIEVVEDLVQKGFDNTLKTPKCYINKDIKTVEDLEELEYTDVVIEDFKKSEHKIQVKIAT